MGMRTIYFIFIVLDLTSVALSWELSGDDATVLTGESIKLKCEITARPNSTESSPIYVWKDGGTGEILFFEERVVQADKERMSVDFSSAEMGITIEEVQLQDEKIYFCGLNGVKPPVYAQVSLTVNQNPEEFYVTDIEVSPVDGQEETVAKCFVNGSKPAPEMWFTDQNGVEIDGTVETTTRSYGLVDSVLTLKKSFTKDDHNAEFTCNLKQADGNSVSKKTKPVKVQFATTAYLESSDDGELKVLKENQPFSETCLTEGNPFPQVQWSFTPDEDTNHTMPQDQKLPENFEISADGKIISATRVSLTTDDLTNDGTFTCEAFNGIGKAVERSFRLQVYASPVTTTPTTPALLELTTKRKEATAEMQPRSASSDAAVIGGVVAVAAFVIVVAIILIVRYFMSHKGTYHTNEMKNHDMDEEKLGGDHLLAGDNDEELAELGHKKRTEYFM